MLGRQYGQASWQCETTLTRRLSLPAGGRHALVGGHAVVGRRALVPSQGGHGGYGPIPAAGPIVPFEVPCPPSIKALHISSMKNGLPSVSR